LYRVDMVLKDTTTYAAFSRPKGSPLEMAVALGHSLRRDGQAGRIVDVKTEEVIESWQGGKREIV
jgi:hypothetical protein